MIRTDLMDELLNRYVKLSNPQHFSLSVISKLLSNTNTPNDSMGSYDCYCAFCGGPLGNRILVGSGTAAALVERARRLEKEKRRLKGEGVSDSEFDDDEQKDAKANEDVDMMSETFASDICDIGSQNEEEVLSSHGTVDETEEDQGGVWNNDSDDEGSIDNDLNEDEEHGETPDDDDEGSIDNDLNEDEEHGETPDDDDENNNGGSEDDSTIASLDLSNNVDSEDSYSMRHSYDPTLVTKADVKWIMDCRCIGFNPNARGVSKAFLSARGTYDDIGSFDTDSHAAIDDNDPEGELNCYYSYDPNILPVVPFHMECYQIFARCVTGGSDTGKINKEALYGAIESLAGECTRALPLDYGGITGIDQFWESKSGEEYCIISPRTRPDIVNTLEAMISTEHFEKTPAPLDLMHKVRKDPFSKLPYDILTLIVPQLSPRDCLSLTRASYHINSTTRDGNFWTHIIHRTIFSWFWELKPAFAGIFAPTLDFKRVYLWLNHVTEHTLGMRGPLMGIANRRRIWNACQQLVLLYKNRVSADTEENLDNEAQVIKAEALSLQMPAVMYPAPSVARNTSKLWIYSWSEIDSHACTFGVSWDAEGTLCRMSVTFNGDSRQFGPEPSCKRPVIEQSFEIAHNDWIQEIVLHVDGVDMFAEPEDPTRISGAMDIEPRKRVGVEGVTITLTSGMTHELGKTSNGLNRRVLAPVPGNHILGLIGQYAKDGAFSRLGLLESSRPDEEPDDDHELPRVQRLLWHHDATAIPLDSSPDASTLPIWHHPHLRMRDFSTQTDMNAFPRDIIPHHALVWARDATELKTLKRISSFEVPGGTQTSFASGKAVTGWYPDILGLQTDHADGTTRQIGNPGPVRAQDPSSADMEDVGMPRTINPTPWAEQNMIRFDVNGAGGEIITEVHVSECAKAVRLITNRGREAYFGEKNRNNWSELRAEDGEVICGLVVCFGVLGGFAQERKRWGHWKTNTVTILTLNKGL